MENSKPNVWCFHGGFTVTCPCGSTNVEVEAFLYDCSTSYHGVSAMPMFYCQDCEREWNPRLTEAICPE